MEKLAQIKFWDAESGAYRLWAEALPWEEAQLKACSLSRFIPGRTAFALLFNHSSTPIVSRKYYAGKPVA